MSAQLVMHGNMMPGVLSVVHRGLEATPIVVDRVMYTSGAWGFVYALDAATGKEIWKYDPNVDASNGRRACCDVVNRGVAVWEGRVYVGTLDGYLICLDAADGKKSGERIPLQIEQKLIQLPALRRWQAVS